ncbi:methyltransferase domain-containing protein [Pseudodesulfovibrio sp. JC047]|uniref:class I SAM-dependent methyltransferase n=1 Tax=Pseudodesulfovibrio sp. JC047 TaxID=2683199 RepID=UPI0013D87220|nr:class I SAM-dependent methyltransferase [Pseudodesulfovibrio sp. JC047]NDV18362.1 methyltransferase domain-containing protein [Pseudodesulfovibrio sp. JC047]
MSHHSQAAPTRHKGPGPTSFWIQSADAVFNHLPLHTGMTFMDAGCGAGEYTLHAARMLGPTGHVIALDTVESSVAWLNTTQHEPGMAPIQGHICDITTPLPFDAQSVDIVLLGTVLHIKAVRNRATAMFAEFNRVLRPNGTLAVLECKKEEADFGPPLHSRLSIQDVQAMAAPVGFHTASTHRFTHTYLLCLSPDDSTKCSTPHGN